mmetsp:Transcript_49690/g.118262  ORF Transcript_49690/g.118262 Transcript_49690/m.118262 type:complete len:276 (+) Transcript_49690:1247-2074(+)
MTVPSVSAALTPAILNVAPARIGTLGWIATVRMSRAPRTECWEVMRATTRLGGTAPESSDTALAISGKREFDEASSTRSVAALGVCFTSGFARVAEKARYAKGGSVALRVMERVPEVCVQMPVWGTTALCSGAEVIAKVRPVPRVADPVSPRISRTTPLGNARLARREKRSVLCMSLRIDDDSTTVKWVTAASGRVATPKIRPETAAGKNVISPPLDDTTARIGSEIPGPLRSTKPTTKAIPAGIDADATISNRAVSAENVHLFANRWLSRPARR